MATAPILTRPRSARASRTPRRAGHWATAQALALALLLLVTQQWGLAHWLQHRGAVAVQGAAATAVAQGTGGIAADGDVVADTAADTACVTCLALAGLGALALPQPPAWVLPQGQAEAPAGWAEPALRAATGAPFNARAPPAFS